MNNTSNEFVGETVAFRSGTAIPIASLGVPFTVVRGALFVGSANRRSCHFVALPGDLLGVEQALAISSDLVATALTEVVFRPTMADSVSTLLATALLQSRRQSSEMDRLRTGPIAARVQYLIEMLRSAASEDDCVTPRLHHAAAVVECTPETICRLFTSLRFRAPAKSRRHLPPGASSPQSGEPRGITGKSQFHHITLAAAA